MDPDLPDEEILNSSLFGRHIVLTAKEGDELLRWRWIESPFVLGKIC